MQTTFLEFSAPNVAALKTRDCPPPGAGKVQVRLAVSSISSGTERANLTGSPNLSWRQAADTPATFPRHAGYSAAGTVLSVGDGVTDLRPGERVALFWSVHSAVQNLSETRVVPLPDGVSFSDAALFHIATFPLAALRKCRLEIGEAAVVMGLGVLGLTAIPLLRAAGAAPVVAVDPVPQKREKALAVGADYALDPFAPDFAARAKSLTGGGAPVGIEVTGNGGGLSGILDCMAPMGRVALLGCTRNSDFSIDYYHKVHGPGISLIGAHTDARPQTESAAAHWTTRDDIAALVRLTACGRLRLRELVDEVHRPAEAPAVYDRLIHEPAFPVVQFDWSD